MSLDWKNELKIDIDRLDHFMQIDNTEKVEEYKDLIVFHVKQMLEENGE